MHRCRGAGDGGRAYLRGQLMFLLFLFVMVNLEKEADESLLLFCCCSKGERGGFAVGHQREGRGEAVELRPQASESKSALPYQDLILKLIPI